MNLLKDVPFIVGVDNAAHLQGQISPKIHVRGVIRHFQALCDKY